MPADKNTLLTADKDSVQILKGWVFGPREQLFCSLEVQIRTLGEEVTEISIDIFPIIKNETLYFICFFYKDDKRA